jgi:hypothetical protein
MFGMSRVFSAFAVSLSMFHAGLHAAGLTLRDTLGLHSFRNHCGHAGLQQRLHFLVAQAILFPPRLTTTQLASSYGSPCRTRSGLAPLSNRACRAHLKKAKILIDNGESTTIL